MTLHLSAESKALTRCWLVSTLPATTAAGYFGLSIQFLGIIIFIGFKQPEFIGIFLSTNNLKQYKTAAMTTGFGALKLFGS